MMTTNIDWSKAPEWATEMRSLRGELCWFCEDGYNFNISKKDCQIHEFGEHNYPKSQFILFETRPTKVKVWNGEGIPPVGTVCENKGFSAWSVVLIRAVTNEFIIFKYLSDDREVCNRKGQPGNDFRPIKTKEQIEAEEREKAIEQMMNDSGYHMYAAFEALYDAGYRKQTI